MGCDVPSESMYDIGTRQVIIKGVSLVLLN